jgi:polar amino acid transport system substrate-binding protein
MLREYKVFRLQRLLFVSLVLVAVLISHKSYAEDPVAICGEPWPPFLYESINAEDDRKDVTGVHLENFRLIKEMTGLDFDFSILPWKRCLHDVENYSKPGDQEIAIDASFSLERAQKYFLVGPIYAIGTAVFYSRNRFPDGPYSERFGRVVSTITDMQDFSICGMLGWNYESYYVEHGIPRSVKVIETPAGFQGGLNMVSSNHCDLLEVHPANVIGSIVTGELEMPDDISCRKLKVDPEPFFLMVSRSSPRAQELVARLSTAIIELKGTLNWKTVSTAGAEQNLSVPDFLKKCS